MKCGHKWWAPYLLSPTAPKVVMAGKYAIPVEGDRINMEQECVLEKGHEGVHRSLSGVIK